MSRTCLRCLSSRIPSCYDAAFHKRRPNIVLMLYQAKFKNQQQQTTKFHTSSNLLRNIQPLKVGYGGTNLMQEKHIRYSDDYIQEKIEEYDLGIRRLAAMMGRDPNSFTEDDVKESIRYLFPSSITSKPARPSLDHPLDFYPREIQVESDVYGRPKHYLFYTMSDLFYEQLHLIYSCLLEAQKLADRNVERKIAPERELNLQGSEWLSFDEVKKEFLNLKYPMYKILIAQLDRLTEEPYAYKYENLIMKFRAVFEVQTASKLDELEVKVDENGREYSEASGKRKSAEADVRLFTKGKGRITINGENFDDFFPLVYDRQVVIAPFSLLRVNMFFDADVTVRGGISGIWMSAKASPPQYPTLPKTAIAGAIRLAIARALQPFVGHTNNEILRRGGLLTQDPRRKERKKPGQWKARKKFTWKKR